MCWERLVEEELKVPVVKPATRPIPQPEERTELPRRQPEDRAVWDVKEPVVLPA